MSRSSKRSKTDRGGRSTRPSLPHGGHGVNTQIAVPNRFERTILCCHRRTEPFCGSSCMQNNTQRPDAATSALLGYSEGRYDGYEGPGDDGHVEHGCLISHYVYKGIIHGQMGFIYAQSDLNSSDVSGFEHTELTIPAGEPVWGGVEDGNHLIALITRADCPVQSFDLTVEVKEEGEDNWTVHFVAVWKVQNELRNTPDADWMIFGGEGGAARVAYTVKQRLLPALFFGAGRDLLTFVLSKPFRDDGEDRHDNEVVLRIPPNGPYLFYGKIPLEPPYVWPHNVNITDEVGWPELDFLGQDFTARHAFYVLRTGAEGVLEELTIDGV